MKLFDDQLIVITGGAGFIGSCLVRYLNDLNIHHLLIVDHLGSSDKWKNLVGKHFYTILDKDQLFSWLEGREDNIEGFIHLGACSDTTETDASYLLENNYRYSIQLAEYALKHDKRFLYASSAATYGNGENGFSDEQDPLHALNPLNMYGFSKQLFDQWVYDQGLVDKMVGLKFFNVFGPNEYHKGRMSSLVCKIVPQILSGKAVSLFKSTEPHLYADGEQKRDFIYVKEAVRMVYQLMVKDVTGLYNIGSGVASTWNSLVQATYEALRVEPAIDYIDMPRDLAAKYQNFSCADTNKLANAIGEQSLCMPLQEAVKDYVQNYLISGKTW